MIRPNRTSFAADPFGYSALALHKWETVKTIAGFPVDPARAPTSADFKSPVLWLAQAHALSEAARVVLESEPSWEHMPPLMQGVCDSQYCAAGLMLVGYSLEICLKAMLILKNGIETYTTEEKRFLHHRLEELADFIPDLDTKDKTILRVLTHFTTWAGRYPDPGSGREDYAAEIFSLSEQYQVAGRDVFGLAARVMKHTQVVINGRPTSP